ncbi:helix-turn-helix domain-containing protein [Amycolatopsis sp. FDAARGOS 1241]|uniref:helix-turn-helix domain-containing protein n=1 Tax=Amycolatopsis sp. FDAARGOS 1241 TaxID=2778070 RepID=UPI0019515188|nr:helix-turn-helix domain-containing protein [Amycolatopsis sp. FDAARGOS 1241]QRP45782.1 helix-turn-helix domain-containing protein [Amycolatopsis sp. FDAARGOS 1241]
MVLAKGFHVDRALRAGESAEMPHGPAQTRVEPTFYNVAEAADLFRLDQSTMYRHLRSGRFPGLKIGGRYVVPRVVVERLVNDVLALGHCIDVADWAARWNERTVVVAGGAA